LSLVAATELAGFDAIPKMVEASDAINTPESSTATIASG
jgi:hypothetical protein